MPKINLHDYLDNEEDYLEIRKPKRALKFNKKQDDGIVRKDKSNKKYKSQKLKQLRNAKQKKYEETV